jgi:hypothetical protein
VSVPSNPPSNPAEGAGPTPAAPIESSHAPPAQESSASTPPAPDAVVVPQASGGPEPVVAPAEGVPADGGAASAAAERSEGEGAKAGPKIDAAAIASSAIVGAEVAGRVLSEKSRGLAGFVKANSRMVMYAGLGLVALSLVFSWWSLTKYRVSYERGVNLAIPGEKQKMLDEIRADGDEEDYNREVAEYGAAWQTNTMLYNEYYAKHIGPNYQTTLQGQIERSLTQGTIFFRGWSTWTGWLALLGIAGVIGLMVAPRFSPEAEQWVWLAPWVAAGTGALVGLLSISFFFNVPDENGAGYSQGVGLGVYLAMLAGLAAASAGTLEGMIAARERLESIESEAEEEEEEQEEAAAAAGAAKPKPAAAPAAKRPVAPPAAEPPPPKNRLMDW